MPGSSIFTGSVDFSGVAAKHRIAKAVPNKHRTSVARNLAIRLAPPTLILQFSCLEPLASTARVICCAEGHRRFGGSTGRRFKAILRRLFFFIKFFGQPHERGLDDLSSVEPDDSGIERAGGKGMIAPRLSKPRRSGRWGP